MKKFSFLLSLFLTLSLTCFAQSSNVKVSLKNGTTITGLLKELIVSDHITINISGIDSQIPMSEVDHIEQIENNENEKELSDKSVSRLNDEYGYYEITDTNNYPEEFTLELDGQTFTMILVRGGKFNMGYDDRHSLSMESEPVHRVQLSSYYVSKECISKKLANQLIDTKIKKNLDEYYNTTNWNKVNSIITSIANKTQKPYRMITEAEWEFLSLMPFAATVFTENKYMEFCYDYFGEYDKSPQINPRGPLTGKRHVTRSFNGRRNKWDRKETNVLGTPVFVRLAIDADKIK